MNVAYLILAHRQPEQLARLVCELQSPSTEIFVHIDAHADIDPFRRAVGSRAHFMTNRIPIHWGDYSLVRAALVLMDEALVSPRRHDYLVLISGTDYPLRSVAEIEDFFRENSGIEFIDSVAMPSEAAAKPLARLTHYKGRPGPVGWWVGKGRRLLGGLGLVPMARDYKKWFGELVPHAGNQWWALTRGACAYIQKFAADHPQFMKFYENTHVPDEMVFQTILANSPFRSNMRRSITYSDWSGGGANPSEIGERHIAMFRANPRMKIDGIYGSGELLFCRKVTDAAVSDQLAVMIRQRNARM
ncbi:beta-1,6-N-acetylglucosaminyltransferase [Bradyrhizobium sp. ISRA443]|uniref:beta-1,6-N-acetylglucosaminyltransferase n=1 Tax=unclassified Bradyrhizobium TaxID=2631580 RepID=UPI00247B24BD|nr:MULTISPECIES: beta-1,6-N-acetylglucosaminyltransferase [unclassified Bradyrhizobium]WGR92791.1 beta-1,6-N-acetylglucosaminyltransferase [Bradyrhizobium sp. ISRA435]WGR97265.1 beta-1,6-N-acetylglucosaminyltransferase [Bradyrhizobium sp. ISRA436]WGS04154.1 beta-1,6-N-acetylglucosaminyltransferase [Bradyrhizobium sp. ISRA437]WGS11037.1 beta-1,6-N-acetylglucosaminyltransferase [Bradyrhizobium sp. ISRA443]